jgi:hypothetical protein
MLTTPRALGSRHEFVFALKAVSSATRTVDSEDGPFSFFSVLE